MCVRTHTCMQAQKGELLRQGVLSLGHYYIALGSSTLSFDCLYLEEVEEEETAIYFRNVGCHTPETMCHIPQHFNT